MKATYSSLLGFLCTLLFTTSATAKEDKDLMKANYYYSHYAYSEALPFFEKLSEENKTADIYEKLGDCYRLTGNAPKAIAAYKAAGEYGKCRDITYLNYGVTLMRLARYAEAKPQLEKYKATHPKDRRVANLLNGCNLALEGPQGAMPAGITSFAPFNTDRAEFAPTLWKGNLVFTADTAIETRKSTDKWSGSAYCGIYSIPCTGPAAYGTTISKIQGPKDLNIKYHTGPATFTGDGHEMFFTRSKYNNGFLARKAMPGKDTSVALEIMIAAGYDTAERKFTTISPFQHNNDNYSLAHPAISPDGKLLVFSSDMPRGTGGRDLYISKKMNGGRWAKPVSLGVVANTEGDEVFPYWADDTTLYFSSDGLTGLGGLDIFRVSYVRATGAFVNLIPLPSPLNSTADDISLAMKADGSSGYFSSDRAAATRGDNIFYYRRMSVFLKITVVDSASGNELPASISARSGTGNRDGATAPAAPYLQQLLPGSTYAVSVTAEGYSSSSFSINALAAGNRETDTLLKRIALLRTEKIRDTMPALTQTPSAPYSRQGIMDSPGIRSYEVDKVYTIGHFDFNFSRFYYKVNKADVNIDKRVVLDTLTNILRRYPTMRILVQAHTDCRGTDEYNMKLSVTRATSVIEYLRKKGIAANRLEYKGFGETAPVVPCPDCDRCTEDEHARNRVLEFKVLKL